MKKNFSFHKSYNSEILAGAFEATLEKLVKAKKYSSVVLFYDPVLVKKNLKLKNLKNYILIPIRANETQKDLASVVNLITKLQDNGVDRKSLFVGLGGGVIGDLVGFLASIYMRGVEYISVPTTLLAMVDSGLGGKNGVNFKKTKNLVGTIKQPIATILDISFLNTLPEREILSGLGEIAKYTLLSSEIKLAKTNRITRKSLEDLILQCARYKLTLVQKDEEDKKGVRQLLNLGHTFGHALEAYTSYRTYRHGEAIFWGLKFSLLVSQEKKIMSSLNYEKINQILTFSQLPPLPKRLDGKKLYALALKDKKSENKTVKMVLLEKRGLARTNVPVSREVFLKCVKYL